MFRFFAISSVKFINLATIARIESLSIAVGYPKRDSFSMSKSLRLKFVYHLLYVRIDAVASPNMSQMLFTASTIFVPFRNSYNYFSMPFFILTKS